jgi:hypothetical protein
MLKPLKVLSDVKGVPADELILAELIQTATAHGYHSIQGNWCNGTKGVCAVGCLDKSRHTRRYENAENNDTIDEIVLGNDRGSRDTGFNIVGDTFYNLFEGANL